MEQALLVEPEHVRQPFNDTEDEQLWLIVGAPTDFSSTLEMSEQDLELMYQMGPRRCRPSSPDDRSASTEDEQLWLIVGAPVDFSSTLEMSEQDLEFIFPDGPKAMPPELA